MSESNRRKLYSLLEDPDNNKCADCRAEKPEWGSYNLGVFLCEMCGSVHRKLGVHISRIKSVKLDNWDRTQISSMEENGNRKSKAIHEKHVPIYYRRPKPDDYLVVREQWIRAKYERKEFVQPPDTDYTKGDFEGYLMKRGKKDGKFLPRKFVLDHLAGTIKYFIKAADKKPKTTIQVVNMNAAFSPQKIHPNGLQLTYLKEGATRNIFVYSEDPKAIIDWYTAIRATKLHHMHIAFPTSEVEELAQYLARDFLMEGFLDKTGPRSSDAFRKRYFVLDDRKLMYMDDPYDAFPNGEIFLGEKDEGYDVKEGIEENMKTHQHGFMLKTPDRMWLFGASSDEDRNAWVNAINKVISKPPLPQEVQLRHDLRNTYPYKKNRTSGGKSASTNSFMEKTLKSGIGLLDRFSAPK